MYYHEKEEFTLKINNKTQFPQLSGVFLADALECFDKPEVKTFEDQDEYLTRAMQFLYKYGTHYLKSAKFGSRVIIFTELKMKKEDFKPSNKTNKFESNIKSGSIQLEQAVDKPGIRFTDFDQSMEIGNCNVDTFKNEFKNCDKKVSKASLLGYEVDHIFNLFNSANIVGSIKMPDTSVVTPDKLENMHKNLKNLVLAVESAMYIRNMVVSDVVVYNNLSNEDKAFVGCLNNDVMTPRFNKFPYSLFSEEHKVGKMHPVFKATAKNFINFYELTILARKKFSTYICNQKKYNLKLEDFISGQMFNKKWIKGIKLYTNHTMTEELKKDKMRAEDCTVLWGGKGRDSDPKKVIVDYLCLKKTTNFLDPELIVDIKVKSFKDDKCESFKLNDREYTCLCETNLSALPKANVKKKTYLCYAKKSDK